MSSVPLERAKLPTFGYQGIWLGGCATVHGVPGGCVSPPSIELGHFPYTAGRARCLSFIHQQEIRLGQRFFDRADNLGRLYVYLPQVLMHELGHVLGLGHLSKYETQAVMQLGVVEGEPLSVLQTPDNLARSALLRQHGH